MNTIAERISRRRKELGLTQKELSEILNVSDKTLSRWETGKQIPDALMMPEIANALNFSLNELYGIANKEKETVVFSGKIDYRRVNSYKVTSAVSLGLFTIGYRMYSYTYDYWNYVKVGAMVLLLLSVFLFFVAELTFQEFYNKIDNTDAYQIAHKKWFGNVIPITGLILGVMIPIFKAPMVIMCNTIDVIFPLLGFQGIMLIFYVRSHLHKRKQGIEAKNFRGIYAAATIGVVFSIAFVICMISNPYRTGAGIQNDWQINMTRKNLKTWELAAGFSFFIMNFLYSKKILDIWGNSFKKLLKYFSITISVVIAVIMAVLGITNLNLNSKVNYEIQEVPVSELTDYDQRIWNWIQECNLSGEEINISRSYRYDPEKGNDITCYLIYMPHGYKGTKIKTNYYLGAGQKVLKLDFRNTSQIVDDKYYLCYLEVINNTEDFEVRTFLDGEPMGYSDNGDTSYVALYRLL